jgi:hypothetical protein
MGGHSWKYTRRYLREALAAALFLSAVGIGLFVYFSDQSSFHRELTITAGSSSGSRSQIARRLREEAKKQGLKLKVIESEGSKQALERVDRGLLDLALVQGGARSRGSYPCTTARGTPHRAASSAGKARASPGRAGESRQPARQVRESQHPRQWNPRPGAGRVAW